VGLAAKGRDPLTLVAGRGAIKLPALITLRRGTKRRIDDLFNF